MKEILLVVDIICLNNKRILWKARTSKARKLINRELQFKESAKRKYTSMNDDDSFLEPLTNPQHMKTTRNVSTKNDDLIFIIYYRKSLVRKMSQEACLQVAQENTICKRFSNGESFCSFFNNSTTKKWTPLMHIPLISFHFSFSPSFMNTCISHSFLVYCTPFFSTFSYLNMTSIFPLVFNSQLGRTHKK